MDQKKSWLTYLLSITFLLYVFITVYAIFHHETWGDEIHSWNIAKASNTLADLIHNTRYEGHPPVWYIILWCISKFTNDPFSFQVVHLIIACTFIYLLLFHSPFPTIVKLLIPFGYFFIFEYSVISRNYAPDILLAFCICLLLCKKNKVHPTVYYSLLLLLSNTHLLALILAGSIHLFFLYGKYEQIKRIKPVFLHLFFGLLIFLPAVYFIFPPSDSGLNIDFWKTKWSSENIKAFAQAPLRAYIPIPAWWHYNTWNTHFLMEDQHNNQVLKFFNLAVSILLTASGFYILKNNKKCLLLFAANFIASFLVAVLVFPMTRERYAGFIFIGLIVALWLYYNEQKDHTRNWLLIFLLILQIPGGLIMIVKDIKYPFSNAYRINELINKVPQDETIVTDYWTVNAVNAFSDKQIFCIDMRKNVPYILWGQDLTRMLADSNRYTNGLKDFLQKNTLKKIYMVSIGSTENISNADNLFFNSFTIKTIDKMEGAINKGGNLYLYEIMSKE